jgi:hypothetical protein
MAFPGEGLKSVWRNNIDEVTAMLQKYHENNFRIWNLSELTYDYSKFSNRVSLPLLSSLFSLLSSLFSLSLALLVPLSPFSSPSPSLSFRISSFSFDWFCQVVEYGFPDHHNPPLDMLFRIISTMDDWIRQNPEHVVVVHCVVCIFLFLFLFFLFSSSSHLHNLPLSYLPHSPFSSFHTLLLLFLALLHSSSLLFFLLLPFFFFFFLFFFLFFFFEQGGKGRTGTVIASYLLFSAAFEDPLQALDFFAERRSKKKKGVTQPSQRRYVRYFSEILYHQLRPFARPLYLHRIVVNGSPNFASKQAGLKPLLQVFQTTHGKRLLWETPPISGVYQ